MTSTMKRKDNAMEIAILEEKIDILQEIAKDYHGISVLKINLDINDLRLEVQQLKRQVE
jgi:hypothetical protein